MHKYALKNINGIFGQIISNFIKQQDKYTNNIPTNGSAINDPIQTNKKFFNFSITLLIYQC